MVSCSVLDRVNNACCRRRLDAHRDRNDGDEDANGLRVAAIVLENTGNRSVRPSTADSARVRGLVSGLADPIPSTASTRPQPFHRPFVLLAVTETNDDNDEDDNDDDDDDDDDVDVIWIARDSRRSCRWNSSRGANFSARLPLT